jgi:hypothetical protein
MVVTHVFVRKKMVLQSSLTKNVDDAHTFVIKHVRKRVRNEIWDTLIKRKRHSSSRVNKIHDIHDVLQQPNLFIHIQ